MDINLTGYYDRFDPNKKFEKHLFRAGYVLQSSEMNEIQSSTNYRIQSIADSIFKDGDIIRDARIIVDQDTGGVVCESGAIYLRGAVRGVPSSELTISTTGVVAIGIKLIDTVVTELDDTSLRDPAAGIRNYQEPGASRWKVDPVWAVGGDDDSNFYPIYVVEDGQLRAKEPPPAFDAVTQAIAKYDRDSSGSNYVVNGMRVAQLDDLETGEQVYTLQEGRARVNGFGIQLNTSRRVVYPATPVLRYIDSEPKVSTTTAAQRVDVARTPISSIVQVRITAEKTVTLNHGVFAGAADPLPDPSVVEIISVVQGGTTYTSPTDYILSAGQVDWSPAGAEPAPGSSYNVTYRHIRTATPTDIDETGFTVEDAVVGTLVLTNYNAKLPRIDRLCMNEAGEIIWLEGVSTDYNPIRPAIPAGVISLAQIYQTWTDGRQLINDGVRTVPMSDIEAMTSRIDLILDLVAQQKLVSDVGTRESAALKGVFTDPFLSDVHRDQGVEQNAASFDGMLMLPIDGDAVAPEDDISTPQTCAFTLEPIISQELRTGSMKINPYMSFGILPAKVTLNPAIDRWTVTQTEWLSAVTREFTGENFSFNPSQAFLNGSLLNGAVVGQEMRTTVQLIDSTSTLIQNLRQRSVSFSISGFGGGEELSSIIFDGIPVTPLEP